MAYSAIPAVWLWWEMTAALIGYASPLWILPVSSRLSSMKKRRLFPSSASGRLGFCGELPLWDQYFTDDLSYPSGDY